MLLVSLSQSVATMVKLVYLHGRGNGGIDGGWLTSLCKSLSSAGYGQLTHDDVVAPRYVAKLNQNPSPSCPLPVQTAERLSDSEALSARCEYERRQRSLLDLLGTDGRELSGWKPPESLPNLVARVLDDVRRYISDEGLRGCILQQIIDSLPLNGEVVIVGHSLGSVIAIDLLDHLPPQLVVRRLITIGSPAGHGVMHRDCDRLLRSFPVTRVRSWVNLWSAMDPVPCGRGVAHLFPAALDVRIQLGPAEHDAEEYLAHPMVVPAIGEAFFGSRTRAVTRVRVDHPVPLTEAERTVLVRLAYAHFLADSIQKDPSKQTRVRAALQGFQDRFARELAALREAANQPLPPEIAALAEGDVPKPAALFDLSSTITLMVSLMDGIVFEPLEFAVSEPQRLQALERLAAFLQFKESHGRTVFESVAEARKILHPTGNGWSKVALAVAGGGLLLAGPVGLALAAPAGLSGAAAIVSALAAFGPGGMLGGLATAGALVSAGTGVTVAALATASSSAQLLEKALEMRLAIVIAQSRLALPVDRTAWTFFCDLETQVARELRWHQVYSDPKSVSIQRMKQKAEAVRRAIEYLVDKRIIRSLPAEKSP